MTPLEHLSLHSSRVRSRNASSSLEPGAGEAETKVAARTAKTKEVTFILADYSALRLDSGFVNVDGRNIPFLMMGLKVFIA